MMIEKKSGRYDWVDVLKLLGMLAIYAGHFGGNAGYIYRYVFTYHVPLFFFASGFFSDITKSPKPLDFILKKAKTLLLPYFIFSFIHLFVITLDQNLSLGEIAPAIMQIFGGIRNTLPASALWFLPCLFIVNILFYCAKKILKNNYLVLILSTVLLCVAIYIFSKNPSEAPSMFFNVDSALYYMYFYVIGAICFPFLNYLYERRNIKKVKIMLTIIFILVLSFSILVFFKSSTPFIRVLGFLPKIVPISLIAFAGIALNILISFPLATFLPLAKYGRLSLFLCGFESTSKVLLQSALSLVGLSVTTASPLAVLIYSILLILLVGEILTPLLCKMAPSIFPYPSGINTTSVQKYIGKREKTDQVADSLSDKEHEAPFKGSK